jgi:thiaminase
MPSLTNHLLSANQQIFTAATNQSFLSHAGCGTLSQAALAQWMNQDSHYTRAYIQFVGALIGKLRLPIVPNSQFHPVYRTLDLLISAINNIRREMGFFENTAMKYGIVLTDDPPNFITHAYMDLFQSASSPSATLLEGMVVLWATGHVRSPKAKQSENALLTLPQSCRTAWNYAASFTSTLSGPTTETHIAALHQSLIPNWTSPAFSKFVDACRSLVDELANSSTDHNGKEMMQRCDQVFKQICWLEERFWPDVDGMGEEDETNRLQVGLGVNGGQAGDTSPAVGYGGVLNGVEAAAGGAAS